MYYLLITSITVLAVCLFIRHAQKTELPDQEDVREALYDELAQFKKET